MSNLVAYPGTANENIHVITLLKNGDKELCLSFMANSAIITQHKGRKII
jgi:hypothetical protein